ncbi:MAG: sulfatase-like hydrolase/transferase [Armatimonadota bacterium]
MTNKFTRREFLKAGTAALAVGIGGIGMSGMLDEAEGAVGKKPNFIVIYTDDHGYGDLGCYGAKDLLTPNLDKLAKTGVRFTNWYANAPICSASRAALLTGRYPIRAGIPANVSGRRGADGLPTDEVTIAKALKQNGYRTAIFGKWHLGSGEKHRPKAHGFDEHYGFLAGCVDYYSHIYYWEQGGGVDPVHDLWHNDGEQWENGEYLTELITEKAVKFIKKQNDDPFFIYLPYNAPHYPMHAPQKYLDRFPNLPPDRRIMAAMIAAADDGIGEVIKALKSTGKYENTVIFFAGDNGPSEETRNWLDGNTDPYTGGSTGGLRGHKGSLFEGGIRVPAMISWPGHFSAGKVCDEIGITMDVFPTIMQIAGVELPRNRKIDGTSILTMVTEGAPSPHKLMLWEFLGQVAVREGNWKLILDPQQNPMHLSNLSADEDETVDYRAQEPTLVARLTEAAKKWLLDVNRR